MIGISFIWAVEQSVVRSGLLFTEGTAVSPEGRITPGDLGKSEVLNDYNLTPIDQGFYKISVRMRQLIRVAQKCLQYCASIMRHFIWVISGIWKDEHIAPLQRIVQFILAQNCVPGMQLADAGRKASRSAPWKGSELISPENGGWVTMGPSPIPNLPKEPPPAEMS